MDFAEALSSGSQVAPHAGCGAGRALQGMEESAAEKVREAFGAVAATHIARTVKEFFGEDVSPQTWNRHIRGHCACDKVGLA